MGNKAGTTLHKAIGLQLRRMRERDGLVQDDIARRARGVGLAWTQATVAAVEAGRRAIDLPELLLLTAVYDAPLTTFFQGRERVQLTERAWADLDALDRLIQGGKLQMTEVEAPIHKWYEPDRRNSVIGSTDHGPAPQASRNSLRPPADLASQLAHPRLRDLEDAEQAGYGDAEMKAAVRLGVTSGDVARTSHVLWGRSLTAERDARLAETAPAHASRKTLQTLRGHVTRSMLAELRSVLKDE
jgi:transcriptional regulator with XRE-family HTH domain